MSVAEYSTTLLHQPTDADLRFLPEGPYPYDEGKLSWVGIQHGAESSHGSLNILDLATSGNESFTLNGRPGFAFPTTRKGFFAIGLEREIGLFDTATGSWETLIDGIDAAVEGTIVNDGVAFSGGIVFGAKDLQFKEKKAGLYLYRTADRQLVQLRNDQICSNGKVIFEQAGQTKLLDIDSPTQTAVAYDFDPTQGRLGEPTVFVDLRDTDVFPDGMIITPDHQSVIIAIYNPQDADWGEARQYGIASGALEAVWKTPGAPQVTCPQLIDVGGKIKLVLTTAVEHMDAERRAKYPDLGSLFIGETPFTQLPETPIVAL